MNPRSRLDWRIDRSSRELVHEGRRTRLAEKPFLVLEALVDADGGIVTREELRRRLWREDTFVDFDNNLNSAVASLRQSFGDSARAPRYIETLPKVGYRLVMPATSRRPRRRVLYAWVGLAMSGAVGWLLIGASAPPEDTAARRDARRELERGRYLRGQFLVARREPELLAEALEAFRTAQRLDPSFAAAAAEESDTLVEASFAGTVAFARGLGEARESARRALELDPASVPALRVSGMTALFLDWDAESARSRLDEAAAISPADPRTALARATLHAALGRHEDAVREAESAVALEPEAYYVRSDLALFYLAAGRNEAALASARRVLEVAPAFSPALRHVLAASERLGRWNEAAEAARSLMRSAGASSEELERMSAAPRAALEQYRTWELARAESASKERTDELALTLALVSAAAGQRSAALDYLERAYDRREALLVFLRAFPELRPLHEEPRFERLARRILRS